MSSFSSKSTNRVRACLFDLSKQDIITKPENRDFKIDGKTTNEYYNTMLHQENFINKDTFDIISLEFISDKSPKKSSNNNSNKNTNGNKQASEKLKHESTCKLLLP